MLAVIFIKPGGKAYTSSQFETTPPPRHQVVAERAAAAVRWNNRTPFVRVMILRLLSLWLPVVVVACRRYTAAGGVWCAPDIRKTLGEYEPMAWRAKVHRTFRPIPAFAKVPFLLLFQENTAIPASICLFWASKFL